MALVWRAQFIKNGPLHRAPCSTPWKVASSKTSGPREQDRSPNIFHNPASEVQLHYFSKVLHALQVGPVQDVGIAGGHLRC